MKSGKMILGLLAGFSTGMLIGVLFAPDKGSNLRKNLSASAKEFADKILSKAEEMVEETEAHSRRTRERAV